MLRDFLGRRRPEIDDPVFGHLEFHRRPRPGWENRSFTFAGRPGVQLLVDAEEQGPTDRQRDFLKGLEARYPELRARIDAAIRDRFAVEDSIGADQKFQLQSIYVPSFQSPERSVWRLWYDLEGEDIVWYGVEMNNWNTIIPFAED